MARLIRTTSDQQSLLKSFYDKALELFIHDDKSRKSFREMAPLDFYDEDTTVFPDAVGAMLIAYSWLYEPQSEESQKVRIMIPSDVVQHGISRDFFGYVEQTERVRDLRQRKSNPRTD